MATIMSRKKLIMIGMVAGSIVGGYLPALFGLDELMVSLLKERFSANALALQLPFCNAQERPGK
jgi:uncharacterized membrane protein YoaK (UPF0700 family)